MQSVIEVFGGVFVLFLFSCRCRGFCHRTESDLFLFHLQVHSNDIAKYLKLIFVSNKSLNHSRLKSPSLFKISALSKLWQSYIFRNIKKAITINIWLRRNNLQIIIFTCKLKYEIKLYAVIRKALISIDGNSISYQTMWQPNGACTL